MAIRSYKESEIKDADKIVAKLKKQGIIKESDKLELLIGSTTLWALNPCFVMTSKEIVVWNKTMFHDIYNYHNITGYRVEYGFLSKLYLYLGGVREIVINFNFNQNWLNQVTDILDSKIGKR